MIRSFFTKIASFGSLGEWIFGGTLASISAIPFVYFLNLINNRMPSIFWGLFVLILIITSSSILFSLKNNAHTIVIHKFLGTIFAFFNIPFTWKIILVGLILFNIFLVILSLYVFVEQQIQAQQIQAQDNQVQDNQDSGNNTLSKFTRIILITITSGITVNAFLRFALWLTL